MTATVGDLLSAVHARTWQLIARLGEPMPTTSRAEVAAGLLAAWPRLAAATVRALEAVPVEIVRHDDVAVVRDSLSAVAQWRELSDVRPDAELVAIATRIGVIADLLVGQPRAGSDVDQAAALGLQANLLAPVYALATATGAVLHGRPGVQEARWALRRIAARTEAFAVVRTEDRAGRYEDVAVAASEEVSLDAAISRWVSATTPVLASRRGVTGDALQTAAGDILIVTAAASVTCAAAVKLGLLDASRGESALAGLAAAHQAWREPTRWPPTICLDGARSPDQHAASRDLRRLITDTMRAGGDWLPAEVLHDRVNVLALLATMRRGLHAAGNVAVAHFQAMEDLVRGRGQLWIAGRAITEPAFKGMQEVEAACRRGWVPLPRLEATGDQLLQAARQALTTTTAALAALDRTAARASAMCLSGDDVEVGLERGRIIARARASVAAVETVGGLAPSGRRADRKALPSVTEPIRPGPRR